MIELIFAIVIIAISIVSLPMMIQTTTKGIENNIIQEAIFAAETILNESTTYYWDVNSAEDNSISGGYSRVVNTGDCTIGGPPFKRVGHVNRQCLDNNSTVVNTVGDATSVEYASSIYSNRLVFETGSAGTGSATYKNSYYATATVTQCISPNSYIQFGQETNNSNLKETEIKITDSSGNTVVVLRAYTANIGEVKPESRIF
ncbi:hypothetical protein [Sulfurimonas sp. NWX79]|uniref:hypothetical protein n=1 Tax=Sulfurimonas sp. NWX79 TaxID=2925412 RepID=UPI003204EAB7